MADLRLVIGSDGPGAVPDGSDGALPEVLTGKTEIKKSPAEIKEEILELFEKVAAGTATKAETARFKKVAAGM